MPPKKQVSPPADLSGKKPANATDLDALRVEVRAEADAPDDVFTVPIADTVVRVKHYLDWPVSADERLIAGRLHLWAEKVLEGDDYRTVWVPLDPTNRQVAAFIQDLEKITGIPFVTQAGSPTT